MVITRRPGRKPYLGVDDVSVDVVVDEFIPSADVVLDFMLCFIA